MSEPAVVTDVADATRLVLLAIRLRAVADTGSIAAILEPMAVAIDGLETLVGRLELAGLVDEGPRGWRLTPDGRQEGERLLAVELDEREARPAVTAGYDRFISYNGPLIRACTD